MPAVNIGNCNSNMLNLYFLVIMLHSNSPKYNYESNTDEWVYNMRELFQTQNTLFVSLLQGVSFIKYLQRLLLFSLINID